ncbi:MAG: glycosyltransferase family 4 protein [Rhodospirillales bacterium]
MKNERASINEGRPFSPGSRRVPASPAASAAGADRAHTPSVALLTGGGDRPYALGLAKSLIGVGLTIDFIGSDFLQDAELMDSPRVRFLNLRGDVSADAPFSRKIMRILRYYVRLIRYAPTAKPTIFHILWNNKFELFDRTLLLLYYKLCGHRLVYTVHNINIGERDGTDSIVNRLTLRMQYSLVDHLFVHTEKMRDQLVKEFSVPVKKISVVALPVNNTIPVTSLSQAEARARLGVDASAKVILFYGAITAYKGLSYLVEAMRIAAKDDSKFVLLIAGRPRGSVSYWNEIEKSISGTPLEERVIRHIRFIPDEETETYFKASDLLVLPYTAVFQSGVLLLGYNFGLPVIATDVGSLKEYIIEGKTGLLCRPGDAADLAKSIRAYFSTPMYRDRDATQTFIREYSAKEYSWERMAEQTMAIYAGTMRRERNL